MSDAEWEAAYRDAWPAYFTSEHMETVVRRHAMLAKGRPKKAAQYMNEFKMMFEIERLHPLEGGIVRRKRRKSRRADFRLVPALIFYPRFAAECVAKAWRYWRYLRTEKAIVKRVCADPARWDYQDIALTKATEESSRRWACSSRPAAASRRSRRSTARTRGSTRCGRATQRLG